MDIFSAYDKFQAELTGLNAQQLSKATTEDENLTTTAKIRMLTTENQIQKVKAVKFYTRKRIARKDSQKSSKIKTICINFQKNLPLPNIATNDVNCHSTVLIFTMSDRDSIFYTYTEDLAHK